MSKLLSLLIVLLLPLTWTNPAAAQAKAAVGNLTCTGGAGVGLILGSKKSYRCSFTPIDGGAAQNYNATITRIGLDIGVTGESVMVWSVIAAGARTSPGFLAGNYTGATADVAIGVGGGAKVLIGGSTASVVLQPVSIQGQTGLNLAVGVAGLTIR